MKKRPAVSTSQVFSFTIFQSPSIFCRISIGFCSFHLIGCPVRSVWCKGTPISWRTARKIGNNVWFWSTPALPFTSSVGRWYGPQMPSRCVAFISPSAVAKFQMLYQIWIWVQALLSISGWGRGHRQTPTSVCVASWSPLTMGSLGWVQ